MPNKDLVSIGIPVYNAEKTLHQSLESITKQSYKNIEIIVSDNNSKDNTYKICEKFSKIDKRIKLFKQSRNINSIKNLIFVYKKSKGNFFMWHPSHYYRSKHFIKNGFYEYNYSTKSIYNFGISIRENQLGDYMELKNTLLNSLFT